MPCISALAATARETHSVKWRAKIGVFYTAAALLVSCIVYHIGLLVLRKIMLDILKWIVYNLNIKRLRTIKNETI